MYCETAATPDPSNKRRRVRPPGAHGPNAPRGVTWSLVAANRTEVSELIKRLESSAPRSKTARHNVKHLVAALQEGVVEPLERKEVIFYLPFPLSKKSRKIKQRPPRAHRSAPGRCRATPGKEIGRGYGEHYRRFVNILFIFFFIFIGL